MRGDVDEGGRFDGDEAFEFGVDERVLLADPPVTAERSQIEITFASPPTTSVRSSESNLQKRI